MKYFWSRTLGFALFLPAVFLATGCAPASPAADLEPPPQKLTAVTLPLADGAGLTESSPDQGLRIFGPGATAAQDLEPEYIAVSGDGQRAWVTLQENNGLAFLRLDGVPRVESVVGLGWQDYGLPGHEADFDDEDSGYAAASHPGIRGLFQPDGVAWVDQGEKEYLLLANEGDVRDTDLYPSYDEAAGASWFDLSGWPLAGADIRNLKVSLHPFTAGTEPAQGTAASVLYSFGGRSWSVRDAANGALVWDSGSDLDARAAAAGVFDNGRSDNKGSEPEGIVVGIDGTHRWAFVGLERASAVAVYEISDVTSPVYVTLLHQASHVRPEGLHWVSAADSPTGQGLLAVGFETSKTLGFWTWDGNAFSWVGGIDVGLTADGGLLTGAEIVDFDPESATFWTIANDLRPRIEVVKMTSGGALTRLTDLDLSKEGAGVNSVALSHGWAAAAVEASPKTDPGRLVVWRTSDRKLVGRAATGPQPDMVVFTPDGDRVLTANEGEADPTYTIDPVGSVTVVTMPERAKRSAP